MATLPSLRRRRGPAETTIGFGSATGTDCSTATSVASAADPTVRTVTSLGATSNSGLALVAISAFSTGTRVSDIRYTHSLAA